MKQFKLIAMMSLLVLTCVFQTNAFADSSSLNEQRIHVVQDYLLSLQTADADKMSELFESNGTVVSTSHGSIDAVNFFNDFLPQVASAKVTLGGVYQNPAIPKQLVAHFLLNFVMKDGSSGGGAFADYFTFSEESAKLQDVQMFERVDNVSSVFANQ